MATTLYTVPNPPGYKPSAAWKRSAFLDDDGTVWIPAVIAGNENMVFLCLSYDGSPAMFEKKHLFVRADWMKREFPDTAEICDKISNNVRSWKEKDAANKRAPG